MINTLQQTIKEKADIAKKIPYSKIEYNVDYTEIEIIKSKNIDHDGFYGIPAVFNPRVKPGSFQIVYKLL